MCIVKIETTHLKPTGTSTRFVSGGCACVVCACLSVVYVTECVETIESRFKSLALPLATAVAAVFLWRMPLFYASLCTCNQVQRRAGGRERQGREHSIPTPSPRRVASARLTSPSPGRWSEAGGGAVVCVGRPPESCPRPSSTPLFNPKKSKRRSRRNQKQRPNRL